MAFSIQIIAQIDTNDCLLNIDEFNFSIGEFLGMVILIANINVSRYCFMKNMNCLLIKNPIENIFI